MVTIAQKNLNIVPLLLALARRARVYYPFEATIAPFFFFSTFLSRDGICLLKHGAGSAVSSVSDLTASHSPVMIPVIEENFKGTKAKKELIFVPDSRFILLEELN